MFLNAACFSHLRQVGSGLGPTLEFYTLVSKELQKSELQIWRGEIVEVPENPGMQNVFVNFQISFASHQNS